MNWFTTDYIGRNSLTYKKKRAEEDGCCEHVEADPSCAEYNRKEMDTWGPVGTYVCCKACHEAAELEEGEELETCFDCKQEVKMKDAGAWKSYDFDPRAGEDPLIICNACWVKEKHVTRRKKDQDDYEEEMGRYEDVDQP